MPEGHSWPGEYPSKNGATSRLRSERAARLVTLGYVLAISMPPLGLIYGIALILPARKLHSKHGVWIIVLSTIALVVWIVILTSGALNTASTDY